MSRAYIIYFNTYCICDFFNDWKRSINTSRRWRDTRFISSSCFWTIMWVGRRYTKFYKTTYMLKEMGKIILVCNKCFKSSRILRNFIFLMCMSLFSKDRDVAKIESHKNNSHGCPVYPSSIIRKTVINPPKRNQMKKKELLLLLTRNINICS